MLRYKFINHTADIEFIAYGRELDEAFKNALLALFDAIAYVGKLKRAGGKTKTIAISAAGADKESLLWASLQTSLSVCDAKGVFAYGVGKLSIKTYKSGAYGLRAKLLVKGKCPECAKFDVKGISKYDMKVEHKNKAVKAYVVIDV